MTVSMFIALLIVGGIFYVFFSSLRTLFGGRNGKSMVCTTCGHHGPTKIVTRGSLLLEIVLWLCFLVPGLIYSIWRISSRAPACTSCGATTLVPADSPMGRKFAEAA